MVDTDVSNFNPFGDMLATTIIVTVRIKTDAMAFCLAVAWLSPSMLTSKYHVSSDSGPAILFYWCVLFISMVVVQVFSKRVHSEGFYCILLDSPNVCMDKITNILNEYTSVCFSQCYYIRK